MGYQTNRCIHRKGMIKLKHGKQIVMYENSHVTHMDIEKKINKQFSLLYEMQCVYLHSQYGYT